MDVFALHRNRMLFNLLNNSFLQKSRLCGKQILMNRFILDSKRLVRSERVIIGTECPFIHVSETETPKK